MKNKKKKIIIIVSSIVGALVLAVAIPFSVFGIRSAIIKTDYSYLKNDDRYNSAVKVDGIELVTQHVSCGYASIEMVSTYYGKKVSEDDLYNKHAGNISTSSSGGFLKEINESIPNKSFVKDGYLNNDELLRRIHTSLSRNNPVAVEWAALYEGEWTLHFSVVTGLDITSDNVTIYNPYGYIENIATSEFINRTTFDAYYNMPLFLGFGFAFGAFDKNCIFYAQ